MLPPRPIGLVKRGSVISHDIAFDMVDRSAGNLIRQTLNDERIGSLGGKLFSQGVSSPLEIWVAYAHQHQIPPQSAVRVYAALSIDRGFKPIIRSQTVQSGCAND